MTRRATSAVAMVCVALIACGAPPIRTPQRSPSPAQLRELWTDPGTSPRDLYWGIGGKRLAPQPGAAYEFEGLDTSGFSSSYDLGDPSGVSWSAKIGPEAQTEVVLSRVLWGIGYHQPPVYYLPSWTLDRCGKRKTIGEARFRPKLSQLERLNEPWSWQQNPFVGTHELSGLLTVLLMFNSTDLKNTNNSLYVPRTPWDGARQWFVVRDLGAALGKTGKLNPRRNWLEGFEARGFITAMRLRSTITDVTRN